MSGLVSAIVIWTKAVFYGAVVVLLVLKKCFTVGFGRVLGWKRWDRPQCLDDPRLGTHGFLALKDVRIHYVSSGPENKPLMLFVHGFPEFWYSWRHQIREFQKDYRVVAIDQRGYSESSKPSGIDNYSVTKLMADLDQVILALGYKSCVLVAHDRGGLVAWTFGKFYPDRVDKLIVLNAPPIPLFGEIVKTNKRQAKMSWYMYFFQLPFLPELYMKTGNYATFDTMFPSKVKDAQNSAGSSSSTSDDNATPYKYTFSQPGAITPAINYYRCWFQRSAEEISQHDLNYRMPALLIWGCKDAYLDIATPNTLEKKVPEISVRRILDGGHFVQFDSPDEVNRIMREWLSKQ